MPKGMSLPMGDIVETVRFCLKSDGECLALKKVDS